MTDAPTIPETLDVLIATPLEDDLVARVAEADPRVRVIYEPALLPPMRWSGDHQGDPAFRRDAEGEEAWAKLLASADVWFGTPGNDAAVLRDVLPRCPRLKFVQGTAAGEAQLVAAAGLDGDTLRRVAITTAAGIHAVPLAEFAVFGLLALAKDARGLERDRAARRWPASRRPVPELRGRTVLVLGLGGIGKETARLAGALGMRVLGVRRNPSPIAHVDEVHPPERLRDLAGRADAMVVTLPLTSETTGMVDAGVLDALPHGAWFVNVGRGAVTDEPALIERLRSGRLGGAALDVFSTEPLPADSPLWDLPNVILSPHGSALSTHENERLVELFRDNLRRLLTGQPLHNRVLPEHPY